jgi:hypothetical protein
MSTYQYRAGLQNVGSYQVGGTPYLTGSTLDGGGTETKIEFPNVTKNILVVNTSASVPIRVHFNSLSDGNVDGGHHYFTLEDKKDNVTLNSKCKEIYLSVLSPGADGSFELVADLTGIKAKEMFALTGSGLTD